MRFPFSRICMALCLTTVCNYSPAQHNVYVNENNRIRIVNNVGKIDFDRQIVSLWSDTTAHGFDVSAVSLMSLGEMDSYRHMVMPQRYIADFDYDIAFSELDKAKVKAEPENTDPESRFYDDFIEHSTWSRTLNVTFDNDNVTVNGDIDSIQIVKEGAHLTVWSQAVGVRYILSGNSGDAGFKLYSDRKSCITLNGVDLTNPQGPVINSQLKKRLFIETVSGTVNILTDGSSYAKVKGEDQRGCIFAEGKICISGQGELYVNGNKKCGIASDDYVHIIDGFIHVNAHSTKGKAVYGKDNVIIGGGVLRTYTDGLAGKGVSSDSLMSITGGVVKAITVGDAVLDDDSLDYSSSCGIKSAWSMNISGCEIYCLSTGAGGKCISAGTLAVVNGKNKYYGTLTIDSADVYVRTSGKRFPEVKHDDGHGHPTEISTSPKGIKSIDKLTINSGNIYVRCSGGASAEGIESKRNIDINGGKIRSYCVDDAMNASGSNITGGDILICSSENDGFDVGHLTMTGGFMYVVGADDAQEGVDTDGKTFKVLGGEIISLASRNSQPNSSTTINSVLCWLHKYVNGVALADADGNIIRAIPAPETYNTLSVLFVNDRLIEGSSYRILSFEKSLNDIPVTEYEFTVSGKNTVLGSKK